MSVFLNSLRHRNALAHVNSGGKSGEGKRRRIRGEEVNPETHSGCGHERVGRQRYRRRGGKDRIGKARKRETLQGKYVSLMV